ncbi:hypothetical protein HGO34_15690 [Agrobacterium vitis]|uniref:hypothetical protein n=1 Tax=Agrobacterium vitis TaxID=373 RepID=UPI001F345A3C|nr:hypothetical protein [Agrobacterium vitis]MCF1498933.1 hypothetical protein [Allorhizobium sp. Av2]MCM2441164.1 hypothetical protein [Agrobacterium vitis]
MTLLALEGQPNPEDISNQTDSMGVMARAGLSTMQVELEAFVNAELKRDEHTALLYGLWLYFLQMHASVAAAVLTPPAYPKLVDLLKQGVEIDWLEHAIAVRKELEQRGGQ